MQDSEQCLPLTRAIASVVVLLRAHQLQQFQNSSAHFVSLIHHKACLEPLTIKGDRSSGSAATILQDVF